jgi:hypothetical protein
MAYTKEQLAEFERQSSDLNRQAVRLELERAKLQESAPGAEGDKEWLLGVEIRKLRAKAKEIYAPVLDAMEDDLKNP